MTRLPRRIRLLHERQLGHSYLPGRQIHRLRIGLDEPLGQYRRRPRPIVTAYFVTNYGWNDAFIATSPLRLS